MPWPNCVIFSAVQLNSRKAAIRPATTLVLPTLRECPPTTMIAMASLRAVVTSLSRLGLSLPTALILLGQPRQRCQFFQILLQRACRCTPEDDSFTTNYLLA